MTPVKLPKRLEYGKKPSENRRPSASAPSSPSAACAPRARQSEESIHRAVARYLATVLTSRSWWCHIPNGGSRSKVEGGRFKAMGVKAGTPDILVVFAGRAHWIELKSEKGVLSPAQKDTLHALGEAGCAAAVARSIDDVRFALKRWMIPMREVT